MKAKKKKKNEREHDYTNDLNETNADSNEQEVHTGTIKIFLITANKDKKFDFTKCLQLQFCLWWELKPHYRRFKLHGSRFQDIVDKALMEFNNAKYHGLSLKAINILCLILKITKLVTHLERNES